MFLVANMIRFGSSVNMSIVLVVLGCLPGVIIGADPIGAYWGQDANEGSLWEACDSGLYSFVIIAYLTKFGEGRSPELNISSHCNIKMGECAEVANDIRNCQMLNVRVFLSIGGEVGTYSIASAGEAANISLYLWNNFLRGASSSRPFGNVTLDGIDFDNDYTSREVGYVDDLVQSLNNYNEQGRLFDLSASPRCQLSESKLRDTLNRTLFHFIWVNFYNNPACEFNSSGEAYPDGSSLRFENLKNSWNQWTSLNSNATVFLRLPTSPNAAESGFIPTLFLSQFLLIIRASRNYGGVMLWSGYHGNNTQYALNLLNDSTLNATGPVVSSSPFSPPSSTLQAPGSSNPDVPTGTSNRAVVIAGSAVGAICVLVAIIVVISFLLGKYSVKLARIWRLYVLLKRENNEDEDHFDDLAHGLLTRFLYQTLVLVTNNFNERIGAGGYGSVFAGTLEDGTQIAVKCLDGIGPIKKSFSAEVETIGSIHHINLVRLIGYCAEKSRALQVYEYMSNGSLDKWIFQNIPELSLDWETRKHIILGVAKGLVYLHEDCRQKIAHLDIKPQNILLDENFNAKVGDFGLSKLIDRGEDLAVSTMRGTVGYLAPDWLGSVITEKVDVYSFGVVVLEILCGRKNLDRTLPEESRHLLSLLKTKAEENRLTDLVDKNSDDMQLHSVESVGMMKLAAWCLQNEVSKRPSMSVVVKVMEGMMDVETDLDYNFFKPPQVPADTKHVLSLSPVDPSILSGPR